MSSSLEGKERNKSGGEEHRKPQARGRRRRGLESSGHGWEGLSRGCPSNPVDGEEESHGMWEPLAEECGRKVLKSDGMGRWHIKDFWGNQYIGHVGLGKKPVLVFV